MEVSASELWEKILKIFEKTGTVNDVEYNMYFKNTEAADLSNGTLLLNCNSSLVKDAMEKYKNEIEETINDIFIVSNEKIKAVFNIKVKEQIQDNTFRIREHRNKMKTGLNIRNRLDNFIVGDNSKMAFNACLAVIENDIPVYNPLFIYGGSGLGKTHLMQAVGNEIMQQYPDKVVIYLPATKLIEEIVNALRSNKMDAFHRKIAKIDVLLIDDVQFLAGKDKTQEVLHDIFNDFQMRKKQIILSSDRPPKELSQIEPRLKSRF